MTTTHTQPAGCDLDSLEALARAATPGPWAYQEDSDAYTHIVRPVASPGWIIASATQTSKPEGEANGRWIAAANPTTVLSLIAAARAAQAPQVGQDALTDAQITAGADVLCDCRKPKRIGRNAAIDVFHAMTAAGAQIEQQAAQAPQGDTRQGVPVAYLHQVVCGDGEPDQALSFAPDNFPLAGTLGYRSLSHQPLYLATPAAHTCTPADERALRLIQKLSSISMSLAADLVQGADYTFQGRDYLDRNSVMERVMEWRAEWDTTSAERQELAEQARAAQGAGTAPVDAEPAAWRYRLRREPGQPVDGWDVTKDPVWAKRMGRAFEVEPLYNHPAPVSTAPSKSPEFEGIGDAPVSTAAAPASVKDALRRCGANTDYHGKLLFSQDEFNNFMSMIQPAADGQQGANRMTERKAKEIGEREGMALAGYVFQSDDGRACIIHQGAVRWLSNEELWSIVHPADGQQGASRAVLDWMACEKIADLPAVDEALRNFTEDATADNATGIIVAVAAALARAPLPAQADGQAVDARDAARYRFLVEKFQQTTLPCFLEHHLTHEYVADGKESIDRTIDCAAQSRAQSDTTGDHK